MTRRISLAALLLMLLWLAGTPVTPPVTAQSSASEIIQLVNNFRLANGLPAFTINNSLMLAAQQQANYMATNNIYSHTGAGGSSPQSRAEAAGYVGWVSENIVGGTSLTAEKGLIWWQNSPVHYAALVSTRYTEVGAGSASGYDQNFYALVVGQPSNSPAAAAPAPNNGQTGAIRVLPFNFAQPGEDGSIVHVVQQGQALWTLSAYYEVSLQDILLYNGLSDDAVVNPGDEITIRLGEGQAPPPTPAPPTTHVIREGQTLWYVANLYQVEMSDLLWYNAFGADVILQPGQEIIIRLAEGQPPPPTPTPQLTHIVKSGDTLWSIAVIYNLGLDQLTAWNNLAGDTLLRIGQELLIRQPPQPTPTETPETGAAAAPTFTPTTSNTPSTIQEQPAPVSFQATTTPVAAATPIPTDTTEEPASTPDLGTIVGVGILAVVGITFLFLQRQQL